MIMNKLDRYKILIRQLINLGIVSSQKELGKKMGYNNPSAFSQVINGKAREPKLFMQKLKNVFPNLNIDWLENGEGEMTIDNSTINTININRDSHGSMTVNGGISGGSIQHGGNLSEIIEKLVNELAEQRRELAEQRRASNKQQELINTLIEKLITDKKT